MAQDDPKGQAAAAQPAPPPVTSYEDGASDFLSAMDSTSAPEEEQPSKPAAKGEGVVSSVVDGVKDIVTNPGETLKSAGRGALGAVKEVAKTAISAGQFAINLFGAKKLLSEEDQQTYAAIGDKGVAEAGTEFIDKASDWIFGPRTGSGGQQFVEDTAQFLTGFLAAGELKVAGKALKALPQVASGLARGAVADFAAFDPHKEQFAELAARSDISGLSHIGKMLSVDENDPELEGRFKRAVSGALVGTAIEGVIHSARLFKNLDILKGGKATKAQQLAAQGEIHNSKAILDDISNGAHTPDDHVVVQPTPDGKYAIKENPEAPKPGAKAIEPVLTDFGKTEDLHTFSFDFDGKQVVVTGKADENGKFRAAFMAADGGPGAIGIGGVKKIGRIVNGMTDTKGFTFDHKGGRAQGERVIDDVAAKAAGPSFDSRWEAEAQAATINEAMAGRMSAAAKVSDEQTQQIFSFAKKITDAKDNPEEIVKLFQEERFNFSYLDAPEKTEALLKSIGEHLAPVFDKTQGRPVVSFDESVNRTLQLAGMLTRDDAPEYLTKVGNVLKNTDANVLLMNSRLTELGGQVAKWSQILDDRPADQFALAEARKALQGYVNFSADVAGTNSGVGRGLNALKARGKAELGDLKFKGEAGAVESAAKVAEAPDIIAGMTAADLRTVTRLFRQTNSPKVMFNTLAANLAKPQTKLQRFGSGLLEYFYNSMLSSPATSAAIWTSTASVNAIEDGVRLLAGAVRRDPVMVREAADLVQGRVVYLKQSLQGMAAAFKSGQSIIDPRPAHRAIPGVAGEVVRTMATRPIAAMDEFWRVNSNLAFVRMNSLKLARRTAASKGLSGKAYDTFITQQVEADVRASIDPATGASRLPAAREFAAGPTFSAPLADGTFGKTIEEAVQNHPFLVPILPFVRTSVNSLDYTFKKGSPLGLFSEEVRRSISSGTPEGAIMATRMAVGTTIWSAAGLAAFGGDITGRGPSDPKLRKMWLQSHQPYSVKVGGKWVSYRRAEPFSTPMSITADLAQIMRDVDDPAIHEDMTKVFYGILASTTSGITNKTYLSGLLDFSNAVGSGSSSGIKKFADGMIGTAVPNLVQLANNDPYLRETQRMFDAALARVPGWGSSLPARYNVFGEPVTLNPGRPQRALNPFPVRDATPQTEDEILKLDQAFQPPPTIERYGKLSVNLHDRTFRNKDGGNLTPYERMMEIVDESDLRGQVDKVISSSAYQRAGDGTDAFVGGKRYRELQDRIERVYSKARKKMLSEYPELAYQIKGLERARRASARSDVKGEGILNKIQ